MISNKILKIWLILLAVLASVTSFEVGLYFSRQNSREKIDGIILGATQNAALLERTIGIKDGEISKLNNNLQSRLHTEQSLESQMRRLEGEVAGLKAQKREFPFAVPSDGVVGTFNGTFGGNMYGMRHLGIDLWTSSENGGVISGHKGNPVHSACEGRVSNIDANNAAVTIICDKIDKDKYHLPAYENVYTHYAHMGNRETGALFVEVRRGQRVTKGQHIGYQGDISSYFPDMRNVHLHFSVFTGLSETDKGGGALNPCLYIGGDCMRAGEIFERK